MGCSASKLDNEDTVRRCKDRRRFMKEAVNARHHLAAAHADYCRSLRVTGSALSSFATGERLSVSDETPAVVIHPVKPSTPPSNPIPPSPAPAPAPAPFSPSPSPSPTVVSSKLPHILSAPSISSPAPNRRRPRKLPPKLPHILSESSPSSSPRSSKSGFSNNFFPTAYQANSTYSTTPSQASSVWNWENFYPPSPPDSEFFDQKLQQRKQQLPRRHHRHSDDNDHEDNETEKSEYDFFRPQKLNHRYDTNSHNAKSNFDEETEREEVQCSEWGDHDHDRYTTTSSSDGEEADDDYLASRSEIGTRSNFGSSTRGESEKLSHLHNQTPKPAQPQQQMYGATAGNKMDSKSEDAGSSAGSYRTGAMMDTKMVVRHRDLKEIVDAIKENFDKAAAAGDEVSEMLEIGRAQLDKSFRQLK
ncbi:hypothetical protein Gorai_014944, partial [Gossypium raimondii]|nr:hypothetical protein [Gossypium raimondii]